MNALELDLPSRGFVLGPPSQLIEPTVVVPADEHLVPVRQRSQPVDLLLDIIDGAGVGEVAGVDEQVAIRHGHDVVVRVRDADDTNGGPVTRGPKGPATQEENDVEDAQDECLERRSEELVQQRGLLPIVAAPEFEDLEEAHLEGFGLSLSFLERQGMFQG